MCKQINQQIKIDIFVLMIVIGNQGNIRRKRGPTRAKDLWNFPNGERIVFICNKFGQPIQKGGGILGGWLGTIARRGKIYPLNYKSWKEIPDAFQSDILKVTMVSK